ncbi:MAG: archaetidylserine decarboxylase [Gammaproteobacteria bacterium]
MSAPSNEVSLAKRLFARFQVVLPHHLLSRIMGRITHCRLGWVKKTYMKAIIRHFDVNLEEAAEQDLDQYEHFNAFFTRELKAGARHFVGGAHQIASPVDGRVSQAGPISAGRIIQAKGHDYALTELLGGEDAWSERFKDGEFATLYLSPRDYHRIHMPLDGELREMRHIPGRLFSVSPSTVSTIPNLFARNERVVCLFETSAGPMAMVLVGAIFVASIATVWHGTVTPPTWPDLQSWIYGEAERRIHLAKGEEMGRFNMGSTVILLYGKQSIQWHEQLIAGAPVQMGQLIGTALA